MRLAMFIGKSRLFGNAEDMALKIVERICSSPHTFVSIYVLSSDPLVPVLQKMQLPVKTMPDALCGLYKEVKQKITLPVFNNWLNEFQQQHIDIGLSFYSSWMPPQLIAAPLHRFINVHPAPLPKLTGYEAELFHVLLDIRRSFGTIHYLAEHFDAGNILARGDTVDLPENMTPMLVYEKLIGGCIEPLIKVLDCFDSGENMTGTPQDDSQRTYATRKDAVRESEIQWQTDTNRKIDCRRCGYCTYKESIPLRAVLNGTCFNVADVLLQYGDYNGIAGEVIGEYEKRPVVRTLEGAAVISLR